MLHIREGTVSVIWRFLVPSSDNFRYLLFATIPKEMLRRCCMDLSDGLDGEACPKWNPCSVSLVTLGLSNSWAVVKASFSEPYKETVPFRAY